MRTNKHKKSFLVIGVGRFGSSFARNMSRLGCEVVAVDEDVEKINRISDQVAEAMTGNIHSEEFLKSLGVENFDAVMVAIGQDIESSILTSALVKELGAKYVLSKANDDLHERILKKVGVDWVITVEREMGRKVALSLFSNKIIDSIELTPDFRLVEILIFPEWVGKKVSQIDLFKNHQLMLTVIKRQEIVIAEPSSDEVFQKDDIAVVCGSTSQIIKIA